MAPVVAERRLLPADCADLGHGGECSRSRRLPSRRAELGEYVAHLERRPRGCGPLVEPDLRLLLVLDRQHAERDRDSGLEAGKLKPASRLARDVLEVRGLPSNDRAEGDDAGIAARLRQGHGGQRQLERAGHRDDRHGLAPDARPLELVERAREQLSGYAAVEACHDHADRPARAARIPFDHAVAVRDAELATRVLGGRRARKLVLFCRKLFGLCGRLRLRFRLGLALFGGPLLTGPELRVLEALAHRPSSESNFRSWWWSRCPSFSRLVAR